MARGGPEPVQSSEPRSAGSEFPAINWETGRAKEAHFITGSSIIHHVLILYGPNSLT